MAKGGYKPGGGRPPKQDLPDVPVDGDVEPGNEVPLDYMLRIMNDPRANQARRDRMAIAAAPFMHARVGETGKKDEKQKRAKTAGEGKFSSAEPPQTVTNVH
jgi:phage terminase small subunit